MLWDLDKTEIRSNLETGSEISLGTVAGTSLPSGIPLEPGWRYLKGYSYRRCSMARTIGLLGANDTYVPTQVQRLDWHENPYI
jgi:hypothetical protein